MRKISTRTEDRAREADVQGHLAHEKQPPPRTLQKDHTEHPVVVLRGGGLFLTSEVPLYLEADVGCESRE